MNKSPLQVANSQDDLTQCLLKVLQIVEEHQDYDEVSLFLSENHEKLNDEALEIFPAVAEEFLSQIKGQQINKAVVLVNFSNLIRQFPLGIKLVKQELAIIACQLALQFLTRDLLPEHWAGTQQNLANAYRERIQGNQAENIEKAIILYKEALEIYTQKLFPIQWAGTNHNLANACRDRIFGNQAENIEKSIILYGEVLKIYTRESYPNKWAMTQNNLANAYRERIKESKDENIEKAVAIYEEILKIYTRIDFSWDWAMTQNNLAAAYYGRIQGDREENLEHSLTMYKEVLKVYTLEESPWDWAMVKHNLAIDYYERIKGDRAENLECSIAAYEESLKVYTETASSLDWAMTKNALGNTYIERIRGNRAKNIEIAIDAYKQALKIRTRKMFPQDWAMTKHNLGSAYRERIQGDRADNLETAIRIYKQSLQIYTRKNFPEQWAMTNNSLANVYRERIREDRAKNIELAIKIYEKVLEIYTRKAFPLDWAMMNQNLGAAYHEWSQGKDQDRLECATHYYQASLEIYQPESFPIDCRRTAKSLGNLYFKQKNWQEATKAYAYALTAAETLYQSCDLLYSKAAELEQTANLPHRAAYSYARTNDFRAAVMTIETGRARGLSESLERDRANLLELAKTSKLADRYQRITQQIRNIEVQQRQIQTPEELQRVTSEDQRNKAKKLRKDLKKVIEQIRQQTGYEGFLLPPAIESIFAASQSHQPLVYLIPTQNGSLALVVRPQEIFPVWIDNFTTSNLQNLSQSWFDAYSSKNSAVWQEEIDRGTQVLWQVMEPIIVRLKSQNIQQAILIPTGLFSFFPLHAAWKDDTATVTKRHYALDSICFSYAPNARSLNECAAIANRLTPDQLLAIENPTQDLANSEREVQAVTNCFSQHQVLRKADASISSLRDALKQCNILHLACHGKTDLSTPLTSGLFMSDGRFTLKDLLELKLSTAKTGGIRLAVLSACETGLIGIENLDEVTSLPTGLLQAGVAGVIASLWSVSDRSTMALLVKFYGLWDEQQLTFNEALRQAQIWLRDSTEGEIARLVGFRTRTPQDRPFIHPYYWSAFTYTGI
jgi:CHAT domain-containing protein